MITGTCHFPATANAVRYYARQGGFTAADVSAKIAAGEIVIGKPPLKPGDTLILLDDGDRYGIEEGGH